MTSVTNKPIIDINSIMTFPADDKIDKINKVFVNVKWDFKVEQKNNIIIFVLFFGNPNFSLEEIYENGDYSIISFGIDSYECICTLCDISYKNNDKKYSCVHLQQNIISIKKYINSLLINPSYAIKINFDVGLEKKKKYLSKAIFNFSLDFLLNEQINFLYIVKSKKHIYEIIKMVISRTINLSDVNMYHKINNFYKFITAYQFSINTFLDSKLLVELICIHPFEMINFISLVYYDYSGNKKIYSKIDLAYEKKLKIEIYYENEKIIARQKYFVFDYTNVFNSNQIYVLAIDDNSCDKILVFKENINETLSILNFEDISYKTMRAFHHNFETIKDSIESSRIINSLNLPEDISFGNPQWKFMIIINDFEINDINFNESKYISLTIDLIFENKKYNILTTDVYSWFKTINEQLLNEIYKFIEVGNLYKDKIIFSFNNLDSINFLEEKILEINRNKNVEFLINSGYISGGKKSKFNFRPKIINDQLIIEVELKNHSKEEINEILNAYRNNLSLIKLSSGKIINFLNLDFENFEKDIKYFNTEISEIEESSFLAPNSNIFFAATFENNSEEVVNFVDNFNNYKPAINISKHLQFYLKPYQINGYLWMKRMLEFNFGCLLADDMGVGKTIQTISIIDDLLKINKNARILIVCPVTLMYNWEKELSEHIDGVKVVQIEGRKDSRISIITYSNVNIFITSYTMFSKDSEYYNNSIIDLMIIDEAQTIKNSETQISKSIREINSINKIAITGTPIENNLSELWSIMNFLNPMILGNKKRFYNNYEKDIYSGDSQKQEILKKIINPFILRRTKQEVLKELPEKIEKVYSIDFSIEEHEIYNSFLEYIKLELKSKDNNKERGTLLFKTILKLRQICCDSRLIGETNKPSSKLIFLVNTIKNLIKENSKIKIIVFSQFTSMIELIQKELEINNIKNKILTGKTNKNLRGKIVSEFENDDSNVFLISLKAGGTGLNIVCANHVFHYDPWWNIAAEMQATDRAHRLGQKKVVNVYKLIMKNSLEEKILTIQYKKYDLFKKFIESNSENKIDLNALYELLGI
ncbi:MAG: DEAD/DEAH box helicase [Mycoplasmoidaceae bacterium]